MQGKKHNFAHCNRLLLDDGLNGLLSYWRGNGALGGKDCERIISQKPIFDGPTSNLNVFVDGAKNIDATLCSDL